MKKTLLLLFLVAGLRTLSQPIDSSIFFLDEKPFELTLSSDLKTLLSKRMQKASQPANVTLRFEDGTVLQENIQIQTRGKFRLSQCYMPPLYLNFKSDQPTRLRPLGKLKLVVGCAATKDDEQLILKEYLAYKMYNLITEKSFRVRLAKIRYEDTRGKIKPYTQFGFLLEDVDDMARRNNCVEVEGTRYLTEGTDREQMTLIALFEYMIGNTDWSVPHYHNIKLIRPITDSISFPYAVPYDLNASGIVNAPYALPQEEYNLSSVRERIYLGFPRTMEEIEKSLDIYRKQKEKMWSLVNNCQWLSDRYKKEVISYLEGFYKDLDNKQMVRRNFIDQARTQ